VPAFLLAAALVAAFTVPAAALRPIDLDEGYYALAAKVVAHGQTPYVSFWYPQAPLMPYAYGGWEQLFHNSWYVLRGLSVLLTVALGCLVYLHVRQRWSSRRLAMLAVLLFATIPLGFQWYPTVKTYALSTLLLFAAYVWAESHAARAWFASGIFLGLAIDVRLLVASAAVAFAFYARRHLGQFLVGLAIGLLPTVWFFVIGPARFVNDTLLSQTTRRRMPLTENFFQKLRIVARVLVEPHFLFLVAIAVLVAVLSVRRRRRLPLSLAIAGTLAITNLLPTPSYAQYFVTLIPFLTVAAIELIDLLGISAKVIDLRVLAVVAVLLVLPAGWSLNHITSSDATRRVADVRAASRAVDRLTHENEVVLAFWPGYVYETHARQIPGLESDFAPAAVQNNNLSPARAAKYHMLSSGEIARAIRNHAVRIIVFGQGAANRGLGWRDVIASAGYRPVEGFEGVTVFALPSRADR
jgi:hypothetical protein